MEEKMERIEIPFTYTYDQFTVFFHDDHVFVGEKDFPIGQCCVDILSDDYLENYITEAIEYLGPAIDRNYERWGHTFTMEYNQQHRKDNVLLPLERNPASYDEAIAQLMDTIKSRGSFLDNNIETLYGYCHKSVNKQFEYQGGK